MTMNERRDPIPFSTLCRSMWSWDLWLALACGAVVAIASTTIDFEPKRAWIAPAFGLSCLAFTVAIQQQHNLRKRLHGSDYGELLRITDQTETKARMPYIITRWVAVASLVCSVPTIVIIEAVTQEWLVPTLLTVVAVVSLWSFFAMLSILRLVSVHDKLAAELESYKEQLDAAERQHLAKSQSKNLGASDKSD